MKILTINQFQRFLSHISDKDFNDDIALIDTKKGIVKAIVTLTKPDSDIAVYKKTVYSLKI